MSAPRSFPPGAGRPFTLWQDPARWPAIPLRLPARGFTLWLNPAVWPQRVLRLPGHGFTVWLDPSRWPLPRLVLPGDAFTLWLNPETWPRSPELSLPSPVSLFVMPISLPPSKAFTLWARPNHVTPIPMRNGLTAAQTAAAAAAPAVTTPLPTAPAAADKLPVPFAHRVLPLAAGLVAILGVNTLIDVAESKKAEMSIADVAADVARTEQHIERTSKRLQEMKASQEKEAGDFTEKTAQIEAKALVLKDENGRLVTQLVQARESLQQTEAKLAGQTMLAGRLAKELEQAKQTAATADNKAEGVVVAAAEEASAVKRAAAAEVVKLRESLARMESEKAAALRDAAAAAQEKAALQQALDALRKSAP